MHVPAPSHLEILSSSTYLFGPSPPISLLTSPLGTSNFGRMHLVRINYDRRFYAIKVLNKDKIVRARQVEHAHNEKTLLEARLPEVLCGRNQSCGLWLRKALFGLHMDTLAHQITLPLKLFFGNNIPGVWSSMLLPFATDIIVKLLESDPVKSYGKLVDGAETSSFILTHPTERLTASWAGKTVGWVQYGRVLCRLSGVVGDGSTRVEEGYERGDSSAYSGGEVALMYGRSGDVSHAPVILFEYTN
ncbi:hypothetical protein V8B97DRAFT_2108784 [Scleroderma yunnanense]